MIFGVSETIRFIVGLTIFHGSCIFCIRLTGWMAETSSIYIYISCSNLGSIEFTNYIILFEHIVTRFLNNYSNTTKSCLIDEICFETLIWFSLAHRTQLITISRAQRKKDNKTLIPLTCNV